MVNSVKIAPYTQRVVEGRFGKKVSYTRREVIRWHPAPLHITCCFLHLLLRLGVYLWVLRNAFGDHL